MHKVMLKVELCTRMTHQLLHVLQWLMLLELGCVYYNYPAVLNFGLGGFPEKELALPGVKESWLYFELDLH